MKNTIDTAEVFDFTLLHKGSVKDLFNGHRQNHKPKLIPHPLCVPEDRTQCVHVAYEELSEGFYPVRCLLNAVLLNGNGWLCQEHNLWLTEARKASVRVPARDRDREVTDSIIQTDILAMADKTFLKVRLSKGVYITYELQAEG